MDRARNRLEAKGPLTLFVTFSISLPRKRCTPFRIAPVDSYPGIKDMPFGIVQLFERLRMQSRSITESRQWNGIESVPESEDMSAGVEDNARERSFAQIGCKPLEVLEVRRSNT